MQPTHTSPSLQSVAPANPDNPGCLLGRCLHSGREALLREWLDRVIKDPAIPTDSLSPEQVGVHFPGFIHELTDTLMNARSHGERGDHGGDGFQYGAARWKQGFLLAEMLRELTHLRCIVIERVVRFEGGDGGLGTMEMLLVTDTVHRFVDRMGIAAITHFLTQGVHEREMVTAAA